MECPSCKKAQSQNHPDIIYVKHEKPNTISIDEIRDTCTAEDAPGAAAEEVAK